MKMEYIYSKIKVREGILITMNNNETVLKKKILDDSIEYGCYYLPSEVCKNILITEGLSGVKTAQAVKRIRSRIKFRKEAVGDFIPAFRSMDQDTVSYYAGELAEGLVKAAVKGKGMEIAIGYPKVLVISVN